MTRPILSICIPTYNRSKCLEDCLKSIVSQFGNKEVFEQVEVIISDNASTDSTTEVVKKFQHTFSNIHYFKNDTNLGFDRNLILVVEKSSGEYCLTLGDDDGFFEGSILYLLEKIKTYRSPYFILNCWGYDNDLLNPVLSKPNRNIRNDIQYKSLKDFVISIRSYVDLVGSFGGISVQLFKRDEWLGFKKKEEYVGTQAVHLFILLSVFKNSKFTILAKPVIKTRNDNMRWDICPGFETNTKRCNETMRIALWISDLYNLSLSPKKMRLYFLQRIYLTSLKDFIKKVLLKFGFRKRR